MPTGYLQVFFFFWSWNEENCSRDVPLQKPDHAFAFTLLDNANPLLIVLDITMTTSNLPLGALKRTPNIFDERAQRRAGT